VTDTFLKPSTHVISELLTTMVVVMMELLLMMTTTTLMMTTTTMFAWPRQADKFFETQN
jgi:hypothetical protein